MEFEQSFDHHISKRFNEDLEHVRSQCSKMGGAVEVQLEKGLQSLFDKDLDLAVYVIHKDKEINEMQLSIDSACTDIVAIRQPAASDLRLIMAVSKMIADLERIGDYAKDLAKLAQKVIANDIPASYYVGLEALGEGAKKMLSKSLDAFARLDANTALEVIEADAKINRAYDSIMRECITYMMDDTKSIKHIMRITNTARSIARIADHSVNLAEYIIYLVRGEDIRYKNIDAIRSSILDDE